MKATLKAKVKRQKAKEKSGRHGPRLALFLLPFAFLLLPYVLAQAQKKPRPALKKGEAKRVVAATPGFKLKNSAVKVKEVSAAGATPVSVVAEVTEALRFARVEDESAPQTTGVFKQKRWRAVEFRTGDRSWEEFDFLAAPLGAERLEAARHALEELVTEFEAQQNANKGKDDGENEGKQDGDAKGKDESKREGKGKNKNKSKGKSGEPLTRGPLTIKQLNALVSSAVAEVVVEATFRLAKDASGKWRVSEVSVADESSGDLAALWQSVDAQKAARARADLEVVRAALEAFRSERGFYVAAEDSAVLMDHLSPRYIKQIIRLDPWHNPYRYAGTTASYTLASDGADGKPGTADDVTLSR